MGRGGTELGTFGSCNLRHLVGDSTYPQEDKRIKRESLLQGFHYDTM